MDDKDYVNFPVELQSEILWINEHFDDENVDSTIYIYNAYNARM